MLKRTAGFDKGESEAARDRIPGRRVCVVLLNWNGWSDTSACLSSLRFLDYSNHEVLVVDNGSTDDSVARLHEFYPEVEVIEAGRNLGFAGGCNVGIERALALHADYIWLLNNDTLVEAGTLRALVAKAESDPNIGAVGSAIYSMLQPDRLQVWGGGYVNFWLGRSRHFERPVPDSKIEFLTGASLLIRRRAVEAVGLLDDEFFMYWEDGDYCFRLRAAGWKLGVAGEARIWHKESSSVGKASARMDAYFNASARRFFQKHGALPAVSLWTGVALSLGKRALTGDWERFNTLWVAVAHSRGARR